MMVCVEAIKHLYEFLDKEVDKSQYLIIKEHIDNCFECRQRYEFEKGVRSLVKAFCVNTTAPAYLHSKIIGGLGSADAEISENKDIQAISEQKVTRALFSPRLYAIAASILLLIAGGVFYYANYYNYDNDYTSIVDNAVKNHVVAVNDNLVFNEKTSVVGNVNKYLGNTINTKLGNSSPLLNAERVSIAGGIPVKFCGTSSPCVIFDKGGNKLSLQIIRNSGLPIRNLERTQFGPKQFYIGNCKGFNSVIWEEDGSTYCLTSDINKNEILRFAATLTSR
ncbi:MAG: mycothiol system anti-sigma-R factor [Planctomycetes bacterium]|nr:mycothiol system anti-sigma-R factor [Planctomycetota bacterium]